MLSGFELFARPCAETKLADAKHLNQGPSFSSGTSTMPAKMPPTHKRPNEQLSHAQCTRPTHDDEQSPSIWLTCRSRPTRTAANDARQAAKALAKLAKEVDAAVAAAVSQKVAAAESATGRARQILLAIL
jgi:hypothetical protein